jgi:hypothetical protein
MHALRGVLCVWIAWQLAITPARAQSLSDEEVIADPELAGSPMASGTAADDGEQIIADPELAGTSSSSSSASSAGSSSAPQSEVHLTLHLRGNRDLRQEDVREELWEGTGALILDATLRRSEDLRFGLGLIARYHYAALAADVPDARAARYELGMLPTAGYVDVSPASGLHVRAGYQTVALGRFDVFSGTNVLTVNDLRDGPSAIPGTTEVGQLALLIDYDPVGWLSLRAIYVPFFMPHLFSVTESDYALFPNRQADAEATLGSFQDLVPLDQLRAQLKQQLQRAARDAIAQSALAGFGPAPNGMFPQGALRIGAHGLFGEIALTFATALEHLPTFRLSPNTIASLSGSDAASTSYDPDAVRVEYNRFAVLSADAAIDVSPFSLGFELAYQLHRTMYAAGTAYPGYRTAIPVPDFTDVIQGGARIEWMQGTTWLFVTEAFASITVQLPTDPERSWMFMEDGRLFRGMGTMLQYSPDFGLHLQLSAAWMSGPTVVLAPRLSYDVTSALELEVGAFIIEGQAPLMQFVTPVLSLGGVYSNLDHVFAGLRGTL